MITFCKIRMAIDVLRGRMPGALAMLKAEATSISVHSKGSDHWCAISFEFGHDGRACGDAYRAMEHLYEIDRVQRLPPRHHLTSSTIFD